MTPITLQVPDMMMQMPASERNQLFLTGLYEAIRTRSRQLKTEVSDAQAQVKQFEARYGVSFEEFETTILPTLTSWEAHEDYNDWFFWQKIVDEKSKFLQQLQSENFIAP